jgi:hypothetical protein
VVVPPVAPVPLAGHRRGHQQGHLRARRGQEGQRQRIVGRIEAGQREVGEGEEQAAQDQDHQARLDQELERPAPHPARPEPVRGQRHQHQADAEQLVPARLERREATGQRDGQRLQDEPLQRDPHRHARGEDQEEAVTAEHREGDPRRGQAAIEGGGDGPGGQRLHHDHHGHRRLQQEDRRQVAGHHHAHEVPAPRLVQRRHQQDADEDRDDEGAL